jgi:thiol:disulfide interchange protein DsbD
LLLGLLFAAPPTLGAEDGFLDPEKVFVLQSSITGVEKSTLSLKFKIAPGYYMYRERFEFSGEPLAQASSEDNAKIASGAVNPRPATQLLAPGSASSLQKSASPSSAASAAIQLGEPRFPKGQLKFDPTFNKEMELYFQQLEIQVPLPTRAQLLPQLQSQPQPAPLPQSPLSDLVLKIKVTGQGCATAGLCYPPMDFFVTVSASAQSEGYRLIAPTAASLFDRLAQGQWRELLFAENDVSLADVLTSTGLLEIVVLFFVLGVLLALTPCVLPMVPILSVLLVGEQQHVSRARGTLLALAYVAGMSVVYTGLGVAAGLSGAGLAAWLQTPWVLALFALLLALLALSMFDVFTFQMPTSLQTKLTLKNNALLGGHFGAAAVMGALSALIVGPCVAAPLAGALLYISQTGDVLLGGLALFAMAWGMGIPLLLMGATAGRLMPRAGAWMEGVKQFFGVLLFGTAWWMLTPLLPSWLQVGGWAVIALFSAVLLRTFDPLPPSVGFAGVLRKTFGLLLVLLSLIWLIGLASGGRSLLEPLSHLTRVTTSKEGADTQAVAKQPSGPIKPGEALPFKRIRTVAELEAALAQSSRPVLLDFYADWCVSCKEMEAFTFTSPEVVKRMDQMLLLQVDVTANNPDDRALLKRYKLFGPPGIIFFDGGGREQKDVRVVGFQAAARFASNLDRVLGSK